MLMAPPEGAVRRGRILCRWIALVTGLACAGPALAAAGDCPALDGHYRVTAFGPVLADAVTALGIPLAGFRDSEVKITGIDQDELRLWVKSGSSASMSGQPSRVLVLGVDFDCADGVLTLRQQVAATRKTDTAFLEGRSSVSLTRQGSGLGLSSEFRGGERSTLFSYDSARISVPRLGTQQTLRGSIRWPGIDEPRAEQPRSGPAPESATVLAARRQLDGLLGGNVRLGWLQDSGGRVRVSLSASRSEDVVAFEDRLHAAGVAYSVTRAPMWSNNQYAMELLVGAPTPAAAGGGWHPSVFRVQQEIERMQHPMVSVRRVSESDTEYVAELDVLGGVPVDAILQRLRANSTLFGEIALIDDTSDAEHANLRHVRLRLRLQ